MSLHEAILAVTQEPDSIKARTALGLALQEIDESKAQNVFEATVRMAFSTGQFFSGLALSRAHLHNSRAPRLFAEFATRYSSVGPKEGSEFVLPEVGPISEEVPAEKDAQAEFAHKIGTDIKGYLPADDCVLPRLPILSELTDFEFVVLSLEMATVQLHPGDVLMKQDEEDETVCILSHGIVEIIQRKPSGEEVKLAEVSAPALLGEMSLITQVPRRATVKAKDFAVAWQVDGQLLKRLGNLHPQLDDQLRGLCRKRLLDNIKHLGRVIKVLDESDRVTLLDAFTLKEVKPGTAVVLEAEILSGLHVILHGEAEVWATKGEGPDMIRVAVLSEGDVFGEISLLEESHASAEVRMPEGGVTLYLPAESYEDIRERIPELEASLKGIVETRKEELNDMINTMGDDFEDLDASWIVEQLGMTIDLPNPKS